MHEKKKLQDTVMTVQSVAITALGKTDVEQGLEKCSSAAAECFRWPINFDHILEFPNETRKILFQ